MKLYEEGNYGDASSYLSKASKENEGKKNLNLKYTLYRCYESSGNEDEAVNVLKDILSYDENYEDAVKALADISCLSEKQFNRIFSEYIGIAPKDFLRIIRLQRTLSVLQHNPGISFAQLSYECGFTDQSHMIKEFKLFSGYTPKEYLNRYAPISDYFSSI